VLAGVAVAAAVSFGVGSVLLGFGRGERAGDDTAGDEELAEARERSAQNKADSKLAPQAT
jgi:mannitol-specific phosphotransferase system IIBC component